MVVASEVLQTFLAQNGLDTFICSQRVSLEGYERLSVGAYEWISVFSAASYGGRFENKGAVCVTLWLHCSLEKFTLMISDVVHSTAKVT